MAATAPTIDHDSRTVLGIRFFQGSAAAAVDRMIRCGGLLVVPAAPALRDVETNAAYREALVEADVAIPDSAYMVLLWNAMESDHMTRLSGLEYLVELLKSDDARRAGNTVWVFATQRSAERNLNWLESKGIVVPRECVYVAPMYGAEISDTALIQLIEKQRPQNVVVTVGGGTQERLGLYLKRELSYRPALHCIGAAIAFLSGDQVRIPLWADRFYLGWLFRSLSAPMTFVPRYWGARKLYSLMRRSRHVLPG